MTDLRLLCRLYSNSMISNPFKPPPVTKVAIPVGGDHRPKILLVFSCPFISLWRSGAQRRLCDPRSFHHFFTIVIFMTLFFFSIPASFQHHARKTWSPDGKE